MADRITDEVNSILSQEDGAKQLSKQAVLDLVDQGASQGGPQASRLNQHVMDTAKIIKRE